MFQLVQIRNVFLGSSLFKVPSGATYKALAGHMFDVLELDNVRIDLDR